VSEVEKTLNLKSTKFFQELYAEIEQMALIKYGKIDAAIRSRIDTIFNRQLEKYTPAKTQVLDPHTEQYYEVSILDTMDRLERMDCIFTYRSVFSKDRSPISDLLIDRLEERDRNKKLMLEAKSAGNHMMATLYDMVQKFMKEVANSIYGVLGEKNFFLYNPSTAGAITGNCAQQLKTLINQIEKIYGKRIILKDLDELFEYLYVNFIDKKIPFKSVKETFDFFDRLDPTEWVNKTDPEVIIEELFGYVENYDEKNDADKIIAIKKLLERICLDPVLRLRLYMLNDINNFLKSSTYIKRYIIENVDNICNLNNFNEKKLFSDLDRDLLPYLENFLYDDHIQSNQHELATKYKRSVVLASDTDSLFVESKELTNLIIETIKETNPESSAHDVSVYTFRLLTYLGSRLTGYQLDKMAVKHHNVTEHRFQYKSEYFYERILFLPVKKTYIGIMSVQEGYKIDPVVDAKNITKTSYTKPSTEFIMDIINEVMDLSKKFNYAPIFKIIEDNRQKIRDMLLVDHNPEAGNPFKYKTADNYENAYSEANFIAGELYNIFYPGNTIPSGTRCFRLDLIKPPIKIGKNSKEEDIKEAIIKFYEDRISDIEGGQTFIEIIRDLLYDPDLDPDMCAYIVKNGGIPYIGIPQGETIPAVFQALLDVDTIIQKNIDVRSVNFLKALGIYVDENSKRTKITNVIRV
jgi:hypothetical protein